MFTLEAVKIAVKLAVNGALQLMDRDEAEELLNKLPEEIQDVVAETTVKAITKKRVQAYGAMLLALDEIERIRKEEKEKAPEKESDTAPKENPTIPEEG